MTAYAVAASPAAGRWRWIALAAGATAAVCAALALWGWFRPGPPRLVARYGLGFPEGQMPNGLMVLSPDGSRLIYRGGGPGDTAQLWVKERAQFAATPLPGTAGASAATVSPDGQWVAFEQGGQLKKMPITGGAAITLADTVFGTPLAWLDDGTLVFTRLPGPGPGAGHRRGGHSGLVPAGQSGWPSRGLSLGPSRRPRGDLLALRGRLPGVRPMGTRPDLGPGTAGYARCPARLVPPDRAPRLCERRRCDVRRALRRQGDAARGHAGAGARGGRDGVRSRCQPGHERQRHARDAGGRWPGAAGHL